MGVKCMYGPRSCRLCLKQSSNSEFAPIQSSNLLLVSIYDPKYENPPYTNDVAINWPHNGALG
jgi:hypothetical protein